MLRQYLYLCTSTASNVRGTEKEEGAKRGREEGAKKGKVGKESTKRKGKDASAPKKRKSLEFDS